MDVPALVDDSNMDHEEILDNQGYVGWDDEVGEGNENLLLGPVKCLFCNSILNSAREVFSHCVSGHSFNVVSFCRRWLLDCIGYIKLINFIRSQRPTPDTLRQLSPGYSLSCPWDQDCFMKPDDPEDLLFLFDIESEDCCTGEVPEMAAGETGVPGSGQETYLAVGGTMTIKTSELQDLITRMNEAEAKASVLEADLERAIGDLNVVKKSAQDLIGIGASYQCGGPRPRKHNNAAGHEEDADGNPVNFVERLTLEEDESYFSGYGNVDIHAEMLQDKVRTEGYRDFLLGNPGVFEGKTVLDIGCGTGILSLFAAKAGAGRVIGVDMSDIIYSAMDIARENKLDGSITYLKGRMDKVQLPCEKVDIIISEWMGYFLLFESMLDTVISARDKYLADGGKVYPDKCSMWLAGFCDEALRKKAVDFWDDVYGFKMSCLKADAMSQTAVEVLGADKMVTAPCCIKEFDVNTCTLSDVNFKSSFTMTCSKDTVLHGFAGYFDIGFEAGCSKQVHFSTGPGSTSTHWKQTMFLFQNPITVSRGQVLEGRIKVNKNREDPRSLDIGICVDGVSHKYTMD